MRKLLLGLGSLILLVVVAIVVAPMLIPAEIYKEKLLAAIAEKTGREVIVGGEIHFTLLPDIAFKVEDVTISNPEGFAQDTMMSLKSLSVGVRLVPLFHGEVVVHELKLVEPVIALERTRAGEVNWQFNPPQDKGTISDTPVPPKGEGTIAFHVGNVKIQEGTLSYRDAASAMAYQLNHVNLSLSLDSDSPIDASAEADWQGKPVSIKINVEGSQKLREGQDVPVRISIASEVGTLDYRAVVSNLRDGLAKVKADGDFWLEVPSLNAFMQWLGKKPILPLDAPGQVTISGKLATTANAASLTDMKLLISDMEAKGQVAVDFTPAVPKAEGTLKFSILNLSPFVGGGEAKEAIAAGQEPPHGWSQDAIDLSALRHVNADLHFTADKLIARNIEVEKPVVEVALSQGVLKAQVKEASLYSGQGQGTVSLDGSGSKAGMEAQFTLTRVDAQPLLTDAMNFNRLSGKLDADIFLSSKGGSMFELVDQLNGGGHVRFVDGSIQGVDIAGMIRNIRTAFTGEENAKQQTDFAELSGSFTIDGGVARNQDLSLRAPLFRLGGAGQADLVERSVNYRLTPKLVGTLKGQGDDASRTGLEVPVIVEGTFDELTFRPDVRAVVEEGLKNPEKIKETIGTIKEGAGDIKEKFKDIRKDKTKRKEAVDKLLKGLLGAPAEKEPTGESPPPVEQIAPEQIPENEAAPVAPDVSLPASPPVQP